MFFLSFRIFLCRQKFPQKIIKIYSLYSIKITVIFVLMDTIYKSNFIESYRKAEKLGIGRNNQPYAQSNDISNMQIPKNVYPIVCHKKLMKSLATNTEPFIVFHAAAGYGKTTVMANWAAVHRQQCSWYLVHESDNRLIRFLYGLANSISHTYANTFHNEGFFNLIENIDEDFDTITLCETFLSCCSDALQNTSLTLCLDNFHIIQNPTVLAFLLQLPQCAEGNLQIMLSTRDAFPAFLDICYMQGAVRSINADELRFTETESALLLKYVAGFQVPPQTVHSIHEYMNGWAAGIVTAGIALKKNPDLPQDITQFPHTHLYHYLSDEVFNRLEKTTQQLLLEASVFELAEAELCDYALQQPDSGFTLETLAAANLFLCRIPDSRSAYRFDPFFKDFLQSRLSPQIKNKLLYRAAVYYAMHKNWHSAIQYGIRCGQNGCGIILLAMQEYLHEIRLDEDCAALKECADHLLCYYDTLTPHQLYLVSRILSCCHSNLKSLETLYYAADLAYQEHCFETYAKYIYELIQTVRKQYSISSAGETAETACSKLIEHTTCYCSRIVCCCMDARLEAEDFQTLEYFLSSGCSVVSQKISQYEFLLEMLRWAINIHNRQCHPEDLLQKARFYRRYSYSFADFGYYCAVYSLYAEGKDWHTPAQEAASYKGRENHSDSIFYQRIRLLLQLDKLYHAHADEPAVRNDILEIEALHHSRGLFLPPLLPPHIDLLNSLLTGSNAAPKKLCVQCLGTLTVQFNGTEVSWRTKKTKELFACLFYEDGRWISKDVLIERLYPDKLIEKALTLFYTTFSYLRKALSTVGCADVLLTRKTAYALDMSLISSDMQTFQRWNAILQNSTNDVLPSSFTPAMLLELYHYGYMYGEDYVWLNIYQEQIEQQYLWMLTTLADRLSRRKEYILACTCLRKALEIDADSIYVLEPLIRCLILCGDIKNAKKEYRRLKNVWNDVLGEAIPKSFEDFINNDVKPAAYTAEVI